MANLNLVAKINYQIAGMAVRIKALPVQNFCEFKPGPVQKLYFEACKISISFSTKTIYFFSKNLISNAYVN